MYPFSTNHREVRSSLNAEEVQRLISHRIELVHNVGSDELFYGVVKEGEAKFCLGDSSRANNRRPVVVMKWEQLNEFTVVRCYLRPKNIIFLLFSIYPVVGLYFWICEHILSIFGLTMLIYLVLIFGVFQIVYRFNKRKTLQKLDDIYRQLERARK